MIPHSTSIKQLRILLCTIQRLLRTNNTVLLIIFKLITLFKDNWHSEYICTLFRNISAPVTRPYVCQRTLTHGIKSGKLSPRFVCVK